MNIKMPFKCLMALREQMGKMLNWHFNEGKQYDCLSTREAVQLYLSSN